MHQFKINQTARDGGQYCEISNAAGLSIGLSSLGAALRSCCFQGRELTLGFADPADYQTNSPYLAVTVGRFANRIAQGHCQVGGRPLDLACNNGPNHLHGGRDSFAHRHWDVAMIRGRLSSSDRGDQACAGVRFSLSSPDGDQGYPGELQVSVVIVITADNQLAFAYQAATTADTIVNLTNHTYWNLQGEGSGAIHDHLLQLAAAGWLAVDDSSIPTGAFRPMVGSDWDFSIARPLASVISSSGARTRQDYLQGIDHNFVIDPASAGTGFVLAIDQGPAATVFQSRTRLAAHLTAPRSPAMAVHTSQPGLQVYTANYLDGEAGRVGPLALHGGLCLEAQLFPDCPNQAAAYRQIGASLGYPDAAMVGWDGRVPAGGQWQALTVHRFVKAAR